MSNRRTRRHHTLDLDSTVSIIMEDMWGLWWREALGVQLLIWGGFGQGLHSSLTGSLSIPCAVILNPSVGISGCPREAGATSPSWECKMGVFPEEVRGPREAPTAQLGLTLELKPASLLGLSYSEIPPAIFSYLSLQLSGLVFKSLSNA